MISDAERAQWWKYLQHQVSLPGDEVIRRCGKDYVRNLSKLCAICGEVFYTYQPVGEERQPCQKDPIPRPGDPIQTREVCGKPGCWDAEQTEAFKRNDEIQKAIRSKRERENPGTAAAPAPKVMRNNQKSQQLTQLKDIQS